MKKAKVNQKSKRERFLRRNETTMVDGEGKAFGPKFYSPICVTKYKMGRTATQVKAFTVTLSIQRTFQH